MTLKEYSENSVVLRGPIGDTFHFKEDLKRMGGKWNENLRCGPGWIFSKNREESVRRWLMLPMREKMERRALAT